MSVLVLFVVLGTITGTNSIATCDEALIAALSTTPECYKDGKAPVMINSKESEGAVGTTLAMTKSDIPEDAKCLTGTQDKDNTYIHVHWNNGSTTTTPSKHEVKDGYVSETDDKGGKFKMYIVHNQDYCFSYYKCIVGKSGGTGTQLVNIAADCKKVKDDKTLAMVKQAKTCFQKLGVSDVTDLTPCDC